MHINVKTAIGHIINNKFMSQMALQRYIHDQKPVLLTRATVQNTAMKKHLFLSKIWFFFPVWYSRRVDYKLNLYKDNGTKTSYK